MTTKQVLAGATVSIVLAALVAIGAIPASAGNNRGAGLSEPVGNAGSTAETGTLALHAIFKMVSGDVPCPPGTPDNIGCHPRTGEGIAPGLGAVSESYVERVEASPAECPGEYRAFAQTARFAVAGRGEIDLAVAASSECSTPAGVLNSPRSFTITGGAGAYAGASGSGTVRRNAYATATGAAGTDTWIGTLIVPGLTFPVTPPTLSGAVNKTVRAPRGAKRVRVTYEVTARDDVDGVVSVSCLPRSGFRFYIGRTVVSCSATDSDGNTRTATFRINVKATR
jgi:hypothetical protein